MSTNYEIKCDGCGEKIVGRPGYPRNDYLVLSVSQAPVEPSNFVYAIAQYPMLSRSFQFHNENCLAHWVDDRRRIRGAREADYERRKVCVGDGAYEIMPTDEHSPTEQIE